MVTSYDPNTEEIYITGNAPRASANQRDGTITRIALARPNIHLQLLPSLVPYLTFSIGFHRMQLHAHASIQSPHFLKNRDLFMMACMLFHCFRVDS